MHVAMRASIGYFGIPFGTMDVISNAVVVEDRWFVGKDSSCVLHLRVLSLWKDLSKQRLGFLYVPYRRMYV